MITPNGRADHPSREDLAGGLSYETATLTIISPPAEHCWHMSHGIRHKTGLAVCCECPARWNKQRGMYNQEETT